MCAAIGQNIFPNASSTNNPTPPPAMMPLATHFHKIGPLGQFGLLVAMSVRCLLSFVVPLWPSDCGRTNQAESHWQDQPGSSPLAGSTRQQTVGRINQIADRGDGYGDEDEYKDEIPSYAVLLTASVERFGVSRMRNFFLL